MSLGEKENLINQLFGNVKNESVGYEEDNADRNDDEALEGIIGPFEITGVSSREEAHAVAEKVASRFERYVRDAKTGKLQPEKAKKAIDGIIKKIEEERKKHEGEPHASTADAEKDLADFMAAKKISETIKVGDLVVRNEFGEKKYKLPMDNQAMIVEEIYPAYQPEPGNVASLFNARVACLKAKQTVLHFNVDLAFYKKKV